MIFEIDNIIKIWDLNSGDLFEFTCSDAIGINPELKTIKILPNETIVIVDEDDDAYEHDLESGLQTKTFTDTFSYLSSIEIISDEVITFSKYYRTEVMNFITGKSIQHFDNTKEEDINVWCIDTF